MNRQERQARNEEIIELFKSGLTNEQIAERYPMTKQGINLILRKAGLSRKDGGATKRRNNVITQSMIDRDKRYIEAYGCDFSTMQKIQREKLPSGITPREAFRAQKGNAKQRGVGFYFKFYEWWQIWEESGKWMQRGKYLGGYVMARKGDIGCYQKDNVEIVSCTQNIVDGYEYREVNSNTTLMLAAQDMYDLLERLSSYDECQMHRKEIDELLAKARGE